MIDELEGWLLDSIRIKEGENCGGMYGWKNLRAINEFARYPFIYNEIIGYSLSIFSFLYVETKKNKYLLAMEDSLEYIKNNLTQKNLLNVGRRMDITFTEKGDLEKQIYSFDNGMVIAGLVNYYKISKSQEVYEIAKRMADSLTKNFFKDYKLRHALLDTDLKETNYGLEKWSSKVGSFHAKVGIGFTDLYNITRDREYLKISHSLCNLAIDMQEPDGSFLNNENNRDHIFLHPHLYACEGLTYIGSLLGDNKFLNAGLKGIKWAISTITETGGVPRNNRQQLDQADCTSQLLRLLLLYRDKLVNCTALSSKKVDQCIDILHERIKRFFIDSEGGIKYDDSSEFACTWCSMFSLQALVLLAKRKNNQYKNIDRLEFFV